MVRKYFRNIPVLFFCRVDGIAQPTGQSFRISKNDGVCNGACHKVQKTSNFGRDTNFKNQTAGRSNQKQINQPAFYIGLFYANRHAVSQPVSFPL